MTTTTGQTPKEARRGPRRIRYGGREHQSREINASDIRVSGAVTYFGSGPGSSTVMAVCKAPRRGPPWVEIIGENGRNIWGMPFNYDDYFLRIEDPLATQAT